MPAPGRTGRPPLPPTVGSSTSCRPSPASIRVFDVATLQPRGHHRPGRKPVQRGVHPGRAPGLRDVARRHRLRGRRRHRDGRSAYCDAPRERPAPRGRVPRRAARPGAGPERPLRHRHGDGYGGRQPRSGPRRHAGARDDARRPVGARRRRRQRRALDVRRHHLRLPGGDRSASRPRTWRSRRTASSPTSAARARNTVRWSTSSA